METFKRFVTYKNLQQYTNALKEWFEKKTNPFMKFKGSVNSVQGLPASPKSGDVYISTGSFTYNNEPVEPGDIFIYTNVGWAIVQGNIDTSLIPTKTSELINDADYISLNDIETVSDEDINDLF